MSFNVTIQGTTIPVASSGESPNWASGIVSVIQAIANALSSVIGPYDISTQSFDISSYNSVSNQNITGLVFSTAVVRSALIRYTVYRNTNSTTVAETGLMEVVYNPGNSSGHKWELMREYTGNASITFNITDTGQVQFTTTSISGTGHSGKISFSAQAIAQ